MDLPGEYHNIRSQLLYSYVNDGDDLNARDDPERYGHSDEPFREHRQLSRVVGQSPVNFHIFVWLPTSGVGGL